MIDGKPLRAILVAAVTVASGALLPGPAAQAPAKPATPAAAAGPSNAEHAAALEKQIEGKEDRPAEEVFKNIRILKGMPAGRVIKIMQFGFGPALDVECAHCHVPGKWDQDEKKAKGIARGMWGMTGDLNRKLKELTDEKATVNCYTCHRGQV